MQRVEHLLDRGSFVPLAAGSTRSPLVAGSGRAGGARVVVACTDGHVRGGTIGLHEASILARIAELAAAAEGGGERPAALILGFDTGGVRVEEGPRALAAAAAAGVGLARLTLMGVPSAAVISGPRGCFGAPAVMAALPDHIVMTANARWGLTGPKLLQGLCDGPGAEQAALQATSADSRLGNGDAHAVVPDDAAAVRLSIRQFVATAARDTAAASLEDRIAASAAVTEGLQRRVAAASAPPSLHGSTGRRRRRDLLRYSFRGQWKTSGAIERRGLIQTALGTFADHPALGIVVGPEQSHGAGVGIEEAAVITKMIQAATSTTGARGAGAVRAAILTFMFCQGHALDLTQEHFGLQRALAECLRAMVAARLRGHPIVSILGGGTYGAAYLALAAPSHRILAMRGTSVAPMAPAVLRAFQTLRGRAPSTHAPAQLAELIPEIHIVDSVIRLPRLLRDELVQLRRGVCEGRH